MLQLFWSVSGSHWLFGCEMFPFPQTDRGGDLMDQQDQLKHISSYTSKLLRQKFGRGPESCHASQGHQFLVLYIRGFICPMEEVLLSQDQWDTVQNSRTIIIDSILPELKGVMQLTLEQEVEEFYHDWNFPNNTGVIIGVLSEPLSNEPPMEEHFQERSAFEKEINRLSEIVQKVPDRVESYQISPKLYIAKREGILVRIEKELARRGYEDVLRVTKNELEKRYFHNDGRFDDILGSDVSDVFIDWNFKMDNSLMCFVLK
jgi:uncharacterized protein YbcI